MYTLSLPVSTIRTKVRQEFERHRYVNQLRTVDVLIAKSQQEYQVCRLQLPCGTFEAGWKAGTRQITEGHS